MSVGWLLVPSLARDHMYAAGSKGPETIWEQEPTLEREAVSELGQVANYHGIMADLHGDRFVLACGTATGIRIVARSAASGVLTWNAFVAGRPTHATLRATATRI